MELRKEVKRLLDKARSKSALGVYSNVAWYRDTEAAYNSIGIHQQAIQAELSRRPVERKRPRVIRALPDHFIDIARERLSKETFEQLLKEAQERSANQHLKSEI